ncbi:MAG TPA: UDP-glucose/GDP-mannose dehydrogenase family protein, partial [bacterium]|nr:UDP-glucose/GDP-mannose dehydrogenase family protein [bacterium]
MNISVIGTGYVGLVSATVFAELGNRVIGVDIDERKIENLKKNILPIYEPGLQELVERNQKEGRLIFTTDIQKGIKESLAIFSAVGTPPDQDHRADLQYVTQVARDFGAHLNNYKILINKSTVPVGTGELCADIIKKASGGKHQFDVVSNPEFLREGAAVKDTLQPDRIVVGVESEQARAVMEELFEPFRRTGRVPILYTTRKNAEIIKYASNSFLATKISYINELANFCDKLGEGVNIKDIAEGMGLDERIGPRFLQAGIGYGGSCFPKDIRALIEKGKEVGYHFRIIQEVDAVNEDQK